jgi:hypothetical protein
LDVLECILDVAVGRRREEVVDHIAAAAVGAGETRPQDGQIADLHPHGRGVAALGETVAVAFHTTVASSLTLVSL